jgi:hypothetical protein
MAPRRVKDLAISQLSGVFKERIRSTCHYCIVGINKESARVGGSIVNRSLWRHELRRGGEDMINGDIILRFSF